MLETGERIIVIASNITKGNIGPRKGSIGYICGRNGNSHCITIRNDMKMYAAKQRVIFSRYGFEKKSRFECRDIVTVLPIFLKLPLEKCGHEIDTEINKITFSLPYQRTIKEITDEYINGANEKRTVICMVVPTIAVNLKNVSEYIVWLESYIRSQNFIADFDSILRTDNVALNMQVVNNLFSVAFEGSGNSRVFLEDKENIGEVIHTIKKIHSMHYKRKYGAMKIASSAAFRSGKADNVNTSGFLNLFSDIILSNEYNVISKAYKNKFNTEKAKEPSYKKIIAKLEDILLHTDSTRSYITKIAKQLQS